MSFLYQLARAGYPFAADDLSIDEWIGLGHLKAELEAYNSDGK